MLLTKYLGLLSAVAAAPIEKYDSQLSQLATSLREIAPFAELSPENFRDYSSHGYVAMEDSIYEQDETTIETWYSLMREGSVMDLVSVYYPEAQTIIFVESIDVWEEKYADDFEVSGSRQSFRSKNGKGRQEHSDGVDSIEMTRLEAFDYLSNAIEQSAFSDAIIQLVSIGDEMGFQFPATYTPAQKVAARILGYPVIDNDRADFVAPDGSVIDTATPVPSGMREQIEEFGQQSEMRFTVEDLEEMLLVLIQWSTEMSDDVENAGIEMQEM